MTNSLAEKMARFSNMGGDKPKPVAEARVFTMPVDKPAFKREKGTLCKMLDEVDMKYIGRIR